MSLLIRPAFADQYPELIIGQTTRLGGNSREPFASLNLGKYTDDDPATVADNYKVLAAELGVDVEGIVGGHQIHGAEVKTVQGPGHHEGYDAFVSDRPGLVLAVTVADCTPIMIYDPVRRVVAAAHAGWRGTVAGVAVATLKRMVDAYGTDPADCHAYLAACIGPGNFEVSVDVAERFAEHRVTGPDDRDKYLVDLKGANADQLVEAGLRREQLEISPYCTVADNDRFFSYRKEGGRTGRMLGVIGLRQES